MVMFFLLLVSGIQFFWRTMAILSVTGVASILAMGWDVHKGFLNLMFSGLSKPFPWFYNSSLYVVFENFRLLGNNGLSSNPGDNLLTVMTILTKAIVLVTFVYVVFKSRSQKWSQEARRHFDFLMAICFFLLISQTLWEHYISVLFLFLAYLVASNRSFSHDAKILVGFTFLFALGQNLIFIDFLRAKFVFDSFFELLFIGLFKSAPVLLTLIFICKYYKELFRSYVMPAWSH